MVCAYNPHSREAETGGSLELGPQLISLDGWTLVSGKKAESSRGKYCALTFGFEHTHVHTHANTDTLETKQNNKWKVAHEGPHFRFIIFLEMSF